MSKKVLFVLSIFVGIIVFFVVRMAQVSLSQKPFVAQPQTITLRAPKDALVGTISTISGVVKKLSRDADDFAPVEAGATLLQGESVATENGQATILFPQVAKITVQPKSEIVFVYTIPTEFLVLQKSGTVAYESQSESGISVRSLHLLVQILGSATLSTDADTHTVSLVIQSGSAKIGANALDDTTHILEVKKGQHITFDDDSREITIK